MGAWGTGIFANDIASDMLLDLEESDAAGVREVLREVMEEPPNDVSSDAAEEGLVAAELVAAAAGYPTAEGGPAEEAVAWARSHPELGRPATIDLARRVVSRVLESGSELRELWQEGSEEDASAWEVSVADLTKRLDAAARTASSSDGRDV